MAATIHEYPTKQTDDFWTVLANAFKLIGASWDAVKLNIATFAVVYLLPLALMPVMAAGVFVVFLSSGALKDDNFTVPTNIITIAIGAFLVIGILVLSIFLYIASIQTQIASAKGIKISPSQALKQSKPFFWKFILLGVLAAGIIFTGLVLLIIPGLLAIFFLNYASYVLVDKNGSAKEAIIESFQLTKRNWKIVLSYFVLQIFISAVNGLTIVGSIVSIALSIAYLCLPAILYLRMQQQNPVTSVAAAGFDTPVSEVEPTVPAKQQ